MVGLDLLLLFLPPDELCALLAAEAVRDQAGCAAAIVLSWRSSASDLRRRVRRRDGFSTAVDQHAEAWRLKEWADWRKMRPQGRSGSKPTRPLPVVAGRLSCLSVNRRSVRSNYSNRIRTSAK